MEEKHTPEKPRFSSPQEEIAYLREQVAQKESALEKVEGGVEKEVVVKKEIQEYQAQKPEEVLAEPYRATEEEVGGVSLQLEPEEHDEQMSKLLELLEEKGVRNTLSIVEKMNNPHIEDDFHRILIEYIKEGYPVADLKEGGPLWRVLNMTLFEIALPESPEDNAKQQALKVLLSSMEQFYAGMLSVSDSKTAGKVHFTLELALSDNSDEIILYASVPTEKKDLFEKQLLSIFPDARVHEQKNDYNIFVENGISLGSFATLQNNSIFPIKTYENFDYDPFNIILNAFSKIEKSGGGASLQIVFNPVGDLYVTKYKKALENIQKGMPMKEAIDIPDSVGGELFKFAKDFTGSSSNKKKDDAPQAPLDPVAMENIGRKTSSQILSSNVRIVASSESEVRATAILSELEAAFNQFEDTQSNRITFKRPVKGKLKTFLKEFSFREFSSAYSIPLSIKELTSLIHFPAAGIGSSPQFKQSKAKGAAAPIDLPQEGTLLGTNRFRNIETNAYLTKEDRVRHLYVIGQTGTGKTTLLKNMITQDIRAGEGVCMIDPHGTDIVDILSSVPEERYDDVIYFDPAYTERVFALNMLEFDPAFPEQKTFVVNELFSIFQKLYGGSPESMGPLFEQYFRNATMLVLEDPLSGSTLLDVSRVLADENFRNQKLSHCNNPVVSQFWKEIAVQAGGEAALANIVPYITSKFDVFIANDYMRPLIAQQQSSFNFRDIMDERKILLVNLSKGRLGDINANLIGLILVGKILMAALSRVNLVGKDMAPFYLYIDEFQNITTDSISAILSEARKYKLSLNVAHQFIAQLDAGIRDAVFGNVGSLAVFRVGSDDAEFLQKQFEPTFMANDIMNIDNYNAYIKILANGRPVKPFDIAIPPPQEGNLEKVEYLKNLSYQKYGKSREEIDKLIRNKYHT